MTVGLRLCSPARPLFPASLPVRVPTVESLSSALSFAPSRFRTSRLTTVAVIDSVGNSHPDSIGTCRAHERRSVSRSALPAKRAMGVFEDMAAGDAAAGHRPALRKIFAAREDFNG